MSFIGDIKIKVKAEDYSVKEAFLHATSEVHVEKLFFNKTPQEVIDLCSTLFSLCPDSQSSAARLCLAAAAGTLNPSLIEQCRWLNYLEIINEGIRYFLLQLAPENFRKTNIKQIVAIRNEIVKLKKIDLNSPEAIKNGKRQLNELTLPLLLKDFHEDWEQDLLNGFNRSYIDNVPAIFVTLNDYRYLGWSTLPLLKKSTSILLEDFKEKKEWLKPHKERFVAKHLTGAIARQRKDPLIAYLLQKDGDTAYSRTCARFVELIVSLMNDTPEDDSICALQLEKGSAISAVQNSRGLLLHYCKISNDGNSVEDYKILTPTEINVTDSPEFLESLKGISASNENELTNLVYAVVASYDPCTQISIEVENA